MNKLEEIHYENGVNDLEYAPYAAEITTDVAVKFAEWIDNMGYRQVSNSFYKSLLDINGKTSQELFEIFINNHYQITL